MILFTKFKSKNIQLFLIIHTVLVNVLILDNN